MNTSLHLLLHSLWISLAFGQEVLYRLKYVDYDFISEEHRNQSIETGQYSKKAVTPIGVLIAEEIFLSIPRDVGVPGSLVTMTSGKLRNGQPLFKPYPDWSWTGDDCDKSIISVYRVDYDKCGRLWVLDNGKIGEKQKCPPKIMAFHLKTRKLLLKKEIPNEYAFNKEGKGLLVTPLVQTFGRRCEKIKIYMADIEGYGLVIWDGKTFIRYESEVFRSTKPDFLLNNVSFHLEDGLAGMALTRDFHKREILYFTALASTQLFHVPTSELTIYSNKTPNYVEDEGDFGRKVSLVIEGNTMYYGSLEDNALKKLEVNTKCRKKNVKTLVKNDEVLQFVSDLKSTAKGSLPYRGIYGLSNKFQKSAAGIRDINEYNFHIFSYKI